MNDLACWKIEVVDFYLFLVAWLLLIFVEVLMGEDQWFSCVSLGRLSLWMVSLSISITGKCIIWWDIGLYLWRRHCVFLFVKMSELKWSSEVDFLDVAENLLELLFRDRMGFIAESVLWFKGWSKMLLYQTFEFVYLGKLHAFYSLGIYLLPTMHHTRPNPFRFSLNHYSEEAGVLYFYKMRISSCLVLFFIGKSGKIDGKLMICSILEHCINDAY